MPIQPGTTKHLWYWQLGTTRILWEKRIRIYKIKRNMISVESDEKKEIGKIVLRGQLFFSGTLLWSSWSINASLRIKNEPHTFLPMISVRRAADILLTCSWSKPQACPQSSCSQRELRTVQTRVQRQRTTVSGSSYRSIKSLVSFPIRISAAKLKSAVCPEYVWESTME